MAMLEMPHDWNDHPGWDRYYRDLCADPVDHVRWAMMDAGMFATPESVSELRRIGWRDIWVPGCGISPLPSLLARAGFNVIATDISPAAVAFQQNSEGVSLRRRVPRRRRGVIRDFRDRSAAELHFC